MRRFCWECCPWLPCSQWPIPRAAVPRIAARRGSTAAGAAPAAVQQCCTVMKTCQEVVYEEQEQTFYKTVYEDVVEQKTVPCVKYVEETQYHCVPCTVMQPRPPAVCGPVKPCGPCVTEEMVPCRYTARSRIRFTGRCRRAARQGIARGGQASALHADHLHSESGDQAGSGPGMLPGAVLLQAVQGEVRAE